MRTSPSSRLPSPCTLIAPSAVLPSPLQMLGGRGRECSRVRGVVGGGGEGRREWVGRYWRGGRLEGMQSSGRLEEDGGSGSTVKGKGGKDEVE